jgi:hypothetical protein
MRNAFLRTKIHLILTNTSENPFMHYAEMIAEKAALLPFEQQAEILRYIEAVAGQPVSREAHTIEQSGIILQQAWGAWGQVKREEIDGILADMRDEWQSDALGFGE